MRGKNQWSQFFVGFFSSFTKNNQRKPTHCGEEIMKQVKVVCRLESMKELLEEEVVNCTTSLGCEELNKWSHDQDKNEAEIQQTEGQKAASCQRNSYSLADDMFKGLVHDNAHARRLSLQNKFVGSTLNSKSPLPVQSLKILRFIRTSVALAGLVILR